MRQSILFFFCVCALFAEKVLPFPEKVIKPRKSPFLAATLSLCLPGLGHYYLKESKTGTAILGGSFVVASGSYFAQDPHVFLTGKSTFAAIHSYGIFSAYRDARLYNDPSVAISKENFQQLSFAPFQWSVIKKPEMWGGYLGALILAFSVACVYSEVPEARMQPVFITPGVALPVAIGEESLFRGFLQSFLSEGMPPWAAITCSSLAFGAAHIPNALLLDPDHQWRYYTFSLPLITSLGAYMGWLTHKNCSLKEGVALHAWYDFTLMCLGALANTASIQRPVHFSHTFDF